MKFYWSIMTNIKKNIIWIDKMIEEKYISQDGDKFVVHRIIENVDYCFGKYSTIEEAIDKKRQLDKEGWPIDMETYEKNKIKEPHLDLSFKVGTSYKHKFMVLTRHETEDLIPRLPYETECDIIFDGIKAKIKLNVLLRLIITKGNEELISHLKELSEENPKQRVNVSFLLNKVEDNPLSINFQEKISMLEKQLEDANEEILLLKEKCNNLENNVL